MGKGGLLMNNPIIISQVVHKPLDIIWLYYTEPKHIVKWNQASLDWHTVSASVDLNVGGRFNFRMEAKDQSMGFNFEGTYVDIVFHQLIHYILDDQRHVMITFEEKNQDTHITVKFEAEKENDRRFQEKGWLSILNHFKRYTENN